MSQELRNNNPVRFRGAQGNFFIIKSQFRDQTPIDKINGDIQGTEP